MLAGKLIGFGSANSVCIFRSIPVSAGDSLASRSDLGARGSMAILARVLQRLGGQWERKKKPPERLRPRGAGDTVLFRERLDGAPW